MLTFRLLVSHSRVLEVAVCIGVEDTTDGVTNLLDLGLKLVVVTVVRVLGTTVQTQGPVHILTVAHLLSGACFICG